MAKIISTIVVKKTNIKALTSKVVNPGKKENLTNLQNHNVFKSDLFQKNKSKTSNKLTDFIKNQPYPSTNKFTLK